MHGAKCRSTLRRIKKQGAVQNTARTVQKHCHTESPAEDAPQKMQVASLRQRQTKVGGNMDRRVETSLGRE